MHGTCVEVFSSSPSLMWSLEGSTSAFLCKYVLVVGFHVGLGSFRGLGFRMSARYFLRVALDTMYVSLSGSLPVGSLWSFLLHRRQELIV